MGHAGLLPFGGCVCVCSWGLKLGKVVGEGYGSGHPRAPQTPLPPSCEDLDVAEGWAGGRVVGVDVWVGWVEGSGPVAEQQGTFFPGPRPQPRCGAEQGRGQACLWSGPLQPSSGSPTLDVAAVAGL